MGLAAAVMAIIHHMSHYVYVTQNY